MTTRYLIRLPDARKAREAGPFAITAQGADAIAGEVRDALRSDSLFARWRDRQPEPDDVDPLLGATDPGARVDGTDRNLGVDLVIDTVIAGDILKHRLRLLAGHAWELRDVRAV